jgi:hypothetical protein
VIHILKSIKSDKHAILGLTLTSLSLIIATSIILISIYSIVYNNPLKDKNELNTIANGFLKNILKLDTISHEEKITYYFEEKPFHYQIELSSESLTISNNDLIIRKKYNINPWIYILNNEWSNAQEFHNLLKTLYGNSGTITDPINNSNNVKNYILNKYNESYNYYLKNPFIINIKKPAILEKMIIYYDINNDGLWKNNEELQQYLLIYQ